MLDYQDYTTQIDHHQGNGNGNGNGYNHLQGDWVLFYKVAKGFTKRVRPEDRQCFILVLVLFTSITYYLLGIVWNTSIL